MQKQPYSLEDTPRHHDHLNDFDDDAGQSQDNTQDKERSDIPYLKNTRTNFYWW